MIDIEDKLRHDLFKNILTKMEFYRKEGRNKRNCPDVGLFRGLGLVSSFPDGWVLRGKPSLPLFKLSPQALKKNMNCWDFIRCPQEYREFCLAYPNYGKICWKVTLISCRSGKVLKSDEKMKECMQCDFYKRMKNNK